MRRRLTGHIDAVLADRKIPDLPVDGPDDADALAMAIELRAARPGAGYPSETFVAELRQRLADQAAPVEPHATMSRRTALVGAAGAIAGAAAATVGLEALSTSAPSGGATLELADGQWVAIATTSDLDNAAIRAFTARGVNGYVSLMADGMPIAVSGACTHQGCLLRPNTTTDRLECPCHTTTFAPDGTLLSHQLPTAPPRLPLIHVRRSNDTIEALLPPITQ